MSQIHKTVYDLAIEKLTSICKEISLIGMAFGEGFAKWLEIEKRDDARVAKHVTSIRDMLNGESILTREAVIAALYIEVNNEILIRASENYTKQQEQLFKLMFGKPVNEKPN